MYDTEEELFRHFTKNVQRNLHVVFTMNPASGDFDNRAATSPALFNRCVVDWFGDWSRKGKVPGTAAGTAAGTTAGTTAGTAGHH